MLPLRLHGHEPRHAGSAMKVARADAKDMDAAMMLLGLLDRIIP